MTTTMTQIPSKSGYQVVKIAGTIQIKDCCDNNNNNNKDENHYYENYCGNDKAKSRRRSRERTLSIDINTSAGVNIVDERTYTFEWNKEEEEEEKAAVTKNNGRGVNNATTTTEEGKTMMFHNGTDNDNIDNNNYNGSNNNSSTNKRIGTLTLDDNVFGSEKRTTLEPVRYDEECQTLTVNALWTRTLPWFGGGGSSYSVRVPISTVLQKQQSTITKQSEEDRKKKVMLTKCIATTSLPTPSPVGMSSSSLSLSSSPTLPSLTVVNTEPASLSVSRYKVFDEYIRRTSEQCAF